MDCPKCGDPKVTTAYISDVGSEVLQKRCQNCGYSWTQKPLDQKESKKTKIPLND